MKTSLIWIWLVPGLFACSASIGPQPTPVGRTAVALAESPAASFGVVPSVEMTASSVPSSTAPPFVPFTVTTWADNVVLRKNPGHLSATLRILPDNTPLTVKGQAPGGEWLLVASAEVQDGWVFGNLVESSGPKPSAAPLVEPSGVMILRGRLMDEAGNSVNGVQFTVLQAGVSKEIRTDAMTDEHGLFYAFLPADSKGSWWVEYTAISCESRVMDATCTSWSGEPDPKGMYVQLPGGAFSPIQFTWR